MPLNYTLKNGFKKFLFLQKASLKKKNSVMQLCQGEMPAVIPGGVSLAPINSVYSHCPGSGVQLEGSCTHLCQHREN